MNHPSTLETAAALPTPVSPLWEHEIHEMVTGVPACSEDEANDIEDHGYEVLSDADQRRVEAFDWVCRLMCLIEEGELRAAGRPLKASHSAPEYFGEDDWKTLVRVASRELVDVLEAASVDPEEATKLLKELRTRAREWSDEAGECESWESRTPRASFYRYLLKHIREHIVGLDDESLDKLLGSREPRPIADGNCPRRSERLEDGTVIEVPIDPFAFKMFSRALQYFPCGYVNTVLGYGRESLEDLLQEQAKHHLWQIETLLELVDERVRLGQALHRALKVSDDDPSPVPIGTLSLNYASSGAALVGWCTSQLDCLWFSDDDAEVAIEIMNSRVDHFITMIEEMASLQASRAHWLPDHARRMPESIAAKYQIPGHLDLDEAMFWACEQFVHLFFLNPRVVSLPPEVEDGEDDKDSSGADAMAVSTETAG